jgi:hypothetical protein
LFLVVATYVQGVTSRRSSGDLKKNAFTHLSYCRACFSFAVTAPSLPRAAAWRLFATAGVARFKLLLRRWRQCWPDGQLAAGALVDAPKLPQLLSHCMSATPLSPAAACRHFHTDALLPGLCVKAGSTQLLPHCWLLWCQPRSKHGVAGDAHPRPDAGAGTHAEPDAAAGSHAMTLHRIASSNDNRARPWAVVLAAAAMLLARLIAGDTTLLGSGCQTAAQPPAVVGAAQQAARRSSICMASGAASASGATPPDSAHIHARDASVLAAAAPAAHGRGGGTGRKKD